MRIKSRPEDFRVSELLADGYLKSTGRFRVYRVRKTKRTSFEAAAVLADLAGCPAGEVGLAGLKDRQGVTTQFMSVPVRKPVELDEPELTIEPIGFANEALSSAHSNGNAFDVVVRELATRELDELERNVAEVREHGLVNYYGEQRFGNLRFGQGWIARELALGRPEKALHQLLCAPSEQDDERHRRFKSVWTRLWGDWKECRDVAGRFGAYHSVFEHLARHPGDFAGAFTYVASRVRLIHLYAWQSHLWNRAVAAWVRESTPRKECFWVDALEGRLFFAHGALAADPGMQNRFRVPGPGLTDVKQPRQRELFAKALELEGLTPEQFRIEGVSGFQLKGEDRELVVKPAHMTWLEPDSDDRGRRRVQVSFELPRGSYATMVLARLFPARGEEAGPAPEREESDERPQRRGFAPGRPPPRRDAPPRRDPPQRRAAPPRREPPPRARRSPGRRPQHP